MDEEIEKVVGRFKNAHPSSMAKHVSESHLTQAASFPKAIPCLEMVLECRGKYDLGERCIQNFNGEVLVYLNCVIIMEAL